MISFTNKSSFNNNYKIIIIDNVEYLNLNSSNALLKVIEEPNEKILFFLIHDSSKFITQTLKSRCIEYKLFLNINDKEAVFNNISKIIKYNDISKDFFNYYTSPGEYLNFYNFCLDNELDVSNIKVEEILRFIIKKSLYKSDLYIKNNLSFFLEILFSKNIVDQKKNLELYDYFIKKMDSIKKFNLDIETFLLEINSKLLNE